MTIRKRLHSCVGHRAASARAWIGVLGLCAALALAPDSALAGQSTIYQNPSETSLNASGGVLDQLYGLSNLTRVEDFGVSPTDQIWFQVASGLATAEARYASLTHRFGFFDGTSSSFTQLFQVSGATQGILVAGPSAVFAVSGPTFRFGLQVVSGSTVQNTWSSEQSANNDGGDDHLVVWRIAGPGNRYALAWEDLAIGSPVPGASEPDYNDLVIEVEGMAPYGCGNGTINPGEQCDDGNTINGDCCSVTCQVAPTGSSCADSNLCNGAETCQPGGVCTAGAPPTCNDGNVCTSDSCSPTLGCQTALLPNGTSCADGDLCNGGETCQTGTCSPGAPLTCNDGNVCTSDSCNPTLGCQTALLPTGTSCADGDLCNGGETCQTGTCSPGTPPTCNDGNVCTSDSCSPALGCQMAPLTNGTSCTDGDACNGAETCQAGACSAGAAPVCDDANACTDDSCNAGSGCVNTSNTASCSDGSECTVDDVCASGVCTPGAPRVCDDGNGCTDDSCNASSGCTTTPNSAACDDGSLCTAGDFCSGGSCLAGVPIVCDDANSCTADSCQPTTGCAHVNDPNVCAPPTASIQPIVECVVENGPGDFTAHFGYLNGNTAPVPIPVGIDNSFSPVPIDRGQPTTFAPGRSPFYPATAFQVDFDGGNLTWTLRSPNGTTLATTASDASGRCPVPPTLLRQYSICYGKVNQVGAPQPPSLLFQTIEDIVEARGFDMKQTKTLCTPAQVTYQDQLNLVVDPATHLLSRGLVLTRTKPAQTAFDPLDPANKNIQVDDVFGTREIDISRADQELLPAAICNPATQTCPSDPANLSMFGIGTEEFKCYRARASAGSPRFPRGVNGINVMGVDPFQSRVYRVTGPKVLCTRANRGGVDPAAATDTEGLMCYSLGVPTRYCEPGAPAPYAMSSCHRDSDCGGSRCLFLPRPLLNDWILGVRTRADSVSQILTTLHPKLLCVPAEITR